MEHITVESIVVGIVVLVYVLWNLKIGKRVDKVEKDMGLGETARILREKEQDEHCEKCKANIMEVVKTSSLLIQEGIQTEREFRVGIMKEQGIDIRRLSEKIDIVLQTMTTKIDSLSQTVSALDATMESNIKHQEELRRLNTLT